ncbi:ParB/RepB/Spo0J family partition protein [Achromobacter sp. Marseille-Q4962]|uniref:DUF7673 family protein n=1 Tax=Achromobacter sp. Marseille-Q4962 TaxID=2942202 RepID=UPI002073CFA0|nr:ParB/RepB/Spo0J family partition protein [Achromobacter sp. Marseille-Q4962]
MSLAAKHDTSGGLDLAGLGELASMLDSPQQHDGYRMYDVVRIHLDPNNVRRANNPGLSPESITEMAATIRERVQAGKRGVLCPISVRPHPTIPGDFVINHGHRRYLGTIEAGLQEIPAYEDPDFDDFDQVMENLHHEQLTGREMADFIGTKLAQGMSQADVARKMGKSRAWVSMHAAMLNLPEPVAEAVANGQVADVTLAKELVVAHRENPEAVAAILSDGAKVTRAQVKALRKPEAVAQSEENVAEGQPGPTPAKPIEIKAFANDSFVKMQEELQHLEQAQPAILAAGEAALRRLLPVAQGDTRQSRVVARFLLNLYNGNRFPFDNTDLRCLDHELWEDCIAVLRMDSRPVQEVHSYFENGSKILEQLAKDWGFRDFHGEEPWR